MTSIKSLMLRAEFVSDSQPRLCSVCVFGIPCGPMNVNPIICGLSFHRTGDDARRECSKGGYWKELFLNQKKDGKEV